MNKDQVAGAVKEYGGKIRKNVDETFGDHKGAAQGAKDEAAGNLRKNYGNVKENVKEALDGE